MADNPIENAVAPLEHGNLRAKEPEWVFQCQHCGKRSRDMYGIFAIDAGYDESCALNSKLVRDPRRKP